LKSIEDENKNKKDWPKIKKQVSDKAILYVIMNQDATYDNYISKNWPDITILMNKWQFGVWAYAWKNVVPSQFQYTLQGTFMKNEIIDNHGPLTKLYYAYGDGQTQIGDEEHIHGDINKIKNTMWGSFDKYDFISEGDSPAYFHLIDVGLDNLTHPGYGGWGGRFKKVKNNTWTTEGLTDRNIFVDTMDVNFASSRWVEVMQRDFAARADWCVADYKNANHSPIITLKTPSFVKAKAGDKIKIEVAISDPDQNSMKVKYWQYIDAGTTKAEGLINKISDNVAEVTLPPAVKKGDVLHFIVEVKDNGKHFLTRYKRVVVEIL
jgi:hypothetical protein